MLNQDVGSSVYLNQYARVKRWYNRLEQINNGKQHIHPSDYYQDEVLAFFMNCYHLKDWLKNDSSFNKDNEAIEAFVRNSNNLSICGDLANGAKHLLITRPKLDSETSIGSRAFSLNIGGDELPKISIRYQVISEENACDAFELATKCLQEWEGFILGQGKTK